MPGLFDGTPLERPVTCEACGSPLETCVCPRDAGGKVLLPRDQTARLRIEKRRGKKVTVIEGIDPQASDLESIAKQLRQACASGGTVNREHCIELQGDHREQVAATLKALGYKVKG